jgi:hypothetical protein
MVRTWAPVLLVALLAAVLSDGYNAGDEGEIHAFVRAYLDGQAGGLWEFLTTARLNGSYLRHHLLWFWLQLAGASALDAVTSLLRIDMGAAIRTWLLVYPLPFMAALSALVAYRALLRHAIPKAAAQLGLLAFYLGGSVTGLLTGGFIECAMLLAVAAHLWLVAPREAGRPPVLPLVLVDWILVAAKPYSLVFLALILPGTLARLSPRQRWAYAGGLALLCAAWFALRSQVPADGIAARADLVIPPLSVGALSTNLFHAAFSLTFGLAWTTPLLLLAGLPREAWGAPLLQKLLAIAALEGVFCLFPFWHGATGVPGQRYVLPYLVILLPEMCAGLAALAARGRLAVIAAVAAVALFLPTLDFRNTFADTYPRAEPPGQRRIDFGLERFPMADGSFHPGVFAWRLAIARAGGDEAFRAALSGGPLLHPGKVVPQTGISRVIAAVNSPALRDDRRLGAVRAKLSGFPVAVLEVLRAVLVLALAAALGSLARRLVPPGSQQARQPGP